MQLQGQHATAKIATHELALRLPTWKQTGLSIPLQKLALSKYTVVNAFLETKEFGQISKFFVGPESLSIY